MTLRRRLAHRLGLGADDHAVGARRRAGRGHALAAVDLDQAQPAGAERLEGVGRAELGDGRRRPRSRRAAPTCRRARRPGGRRSVTVTDRRRRRGSAGVPKSTSGSQMLCWSTQSYGCCARSARSKSSGKCLIALCTGIGVSPPIAHSDPLVIVSQRSSSSTRLAATSCAGDDPVDGLDAARRTRPGTACTCRTTHRSRTPSRSAPSAPCRRCRRRPRCRRARASRRTRRGPRSPSARRSRSAGT